MYSNSKRLFILLQISIATCDYVKHGTCSAHDMYISNAVTAKTCTPVTVGGFLWAKLSIDPPTHIIIIVV